MVIRHFREAGARAVRYVGGPLGWWGPLVARREFRGAFREYREGLGSRAA